MKAALVTNVPSSYRRDLFEALGRRGDLTWTVLFARPRLRSSVPRDLPSGVRWSFARGGSSLGTLLFLLRNRPDVVVVGGVGAPAVICLLYCGLRRLPLGIWWGGTRASERRHGALRTSYRRRVVSRAAFFLCYAPESAEYLAQLGAPPSRLTVLGNATLDVEMFRAHADQARMRAQHMRDVLRLERPVILSVGRLVPHKNHQRLLRAFLAMRARIGTGSLLLVGEGPERACLGGSHVVILDRVPWNRMPELYGICDVYAHASLRDLWPQAVSEAMAAGVAMVVSEQSGFRDFLVDGVNARIVNGSDEAALYDALEELASSEKLRARLGDAGHDAVRALGAQHVADRMTRIAISYCRRG